MLSLMIGLIMELVKINEFLVYTVDRGYVLELGFYY